jgi:hypothetical protein
LPRDSPPTSFCSAASATWKIIHRLVRGYGTRLLRLQLELIQAELAADFEAGGRATIEAARQSVPAAYIRIVAPLLRKQQALTDKGGGPITVMWLPSQS